MGVTADGEEGGVAEAHLASVAGQQHEAHAGDGPDEDARDLTYEEVVQHERKPHGEHDESGIATGLIAVGEQPDVMVVAGLEGNAHRFRASCL